MCGCERSAIRRKQEQRHNREHQNEHELRREGQHSNRLLHRILNRLGEEVATLRCRPGYDLCSLERVNEFPLRIGRWTAPRRGARSPKLFEENSRTAASK